MFFDTLFSKNRKNTFFAVFLYRVMEMNYDR